MNGSLPQKVALVYCAEPVRHGPDNHRGQTPAVKDLMVWKPRFS